MSQDSVVTEEMKGMVGKEWGPSTYEIEKGWIKRFADAIDDPNPLYYDEEYAKKTRFGGIVAPPGFIAGLREDGGSDWFRDAKCSLNKGALNGGNDVEFIKHIYAGDVISVTERITGITAKETKRGMMLFCNFEKTYTNQKGELVAKMRNTGIRF